MSDTVSLHKWVSTLFLLSTGNSNIRLLHILNGGWENATIANLFALRVDILVVPADTIVTINAKPSGGTRSVFLKRLTRAERAELFNDSLQVCVNLRLI